MGRKNQRTANSTYKKLAVHWFNEASASGPFTNIVTNTPNSGTYQWQIPVVTSGDCYLKFTIDNGSTTFVATTAGPFFIDDCSFIAGINENVVAPELVVYPNPSYGGLFRISSSIPLEKIEVYNLMGELVYFTVTGQSEVMLDLTAFPSGLYLVNAISRTRTLLRKKIVNLR